MRSTTSTEAHATPTSTPHTYTTSPVRPPPPTHPPRLDLGFEGAAVAWNSVQFVSLSLLVLYVLHHNRRQDPGKRTWCGFSSEAFNDWGTYIHMAVPSTIMICLDWWTFEIIVLLSGEWQARQRGYG